MTGQEFLEQLDCYFRQDQMEEAGDFLQKTYAKALERGDVSLQLTVLNEMMGYARSTGNEPMGIAGVAECAQLIEECGLQNNPSVGTMWINMGTTLCCFDRVEESLAYYRMAEHQLLEYYSRLEGLPDSSERTQALQQAGRDLAAFYNNVASPYTKKQEFKEAEQCYQKALRLLTGLPQTQEDQAVSLGNLAQLYALWGQKELLQETVNQLDRLLEDEDFRKQTAYKDACRKCARIYENLGMQQKSLQLMEIQQERSGEMEQKKLQTGTNQENSTTGKSGGTLLGLELSKHFWEEVGRPAFRQAFPEVTERLCVGLAGEGSECFGFDDEISQDHDFGPSFCVWMDEEDYNRYGEAMQQLYDSLPREYPGVKKGIATAEGKGRRGVMRAGEFYRRLTGDPQGPETVQDWLLVPEYALAAATNGQIFQQGGNAFLQIRRRLQKGYPEDVRKKKIAAHAVYMAQSGQYNYRRCLLHGEEGAAVLALSEFVTHAAHMIYLLNHSYCTYYKWMLRGVRELPILGEWEQALNALLVAPNGEKNISVKQQIIEECCKAVIGELKRQGLSNVESDYLEPHGLAVQAGIGDETLRAMHVMQGI